MKALIATVLLLLPAPLLAQNFPNLQQGDMQQMMQQMQKMQQCLENIDQSRMQELQQEAEQVQQEIQQLCDQGKRDQAQERAIEYGRRIASDPAMKQLQKCGEMAQGALPNMPEIYDEKEYQDKHVCD